MLEKILCAIDGSHSSEKAVDFAVALANKVGAELTFVIIRTMDAQHAAKERYWDSRVLGAAEMQAQQEFAAARKAANAAGLDGIECVEAYGRDIGGAIVDFAEKQGFGHIVTGSSGRSGVERLVLGSVAADVVAKAHCPVTIAR